MKNEAKDIINSAVLKMIEHTGSNKKLASLKSKHDVKVHFVPKRYRVFGGLLQSLNIQFGNFIETLMSLLVANEEKYEINKKYSGKKSNKFPLSKANDARIDAYITKCQYDSDFNLDVEFSALLQSIVEDNDEELMTFKHDIDLLFEDKTTGIMYYIECKYNDDHDTGKFVDISRKFIKTYAYLAKEFNITDSQKIVPILFYFTNKRMKGNIYIPEKSNIRRGKKFFEDFLSIPYSDVDDYMKNLSEREDVVKMFDDLYKKVMAL